MASVYAERMKEIEKLAIEIAVGRVEPVKAREIMNLSKGLVGHIIKLEEILAAIADDLSPRLLAPFVEYVHIERARALVTAACDGILPVQAQANKNRVLAFRELKRVVQKHIEDGHDRNGELEQAIADVEARIIRQTT